MNIVKLKDIVKPNDDFFNEHLKGKYAWWVHMRYIIPFTHMGVQGYIACEEDINDLFKPPFNTEYRDTYNKEMWKYIDQKATDEANCVNKFKMRNQYTSDADITEDEVKKFRTWLATELLKFDRNNKEEQAYKLFDYKQTHTLQYYKNLMYDETIKILSSFASSNTTTQQLQTYPCGCDGNADLSSLYLSSSCDTITAYRTSVYNEMVNMFSEIGFWEQFSTEFILEFKKYVDNIINMNLSLQNSNYVDIYSDCTCINSNQTPNQDILKRLSNALQWIADGQTAGHKNYIADALLDWSSKLYEHMQWS